LRCRRADGAEPCARVAPCPLRAGGTVDYEIEVEELKDRKRGASRIAIGAVLSCALLLLLRHLM